MTFLKERITRFKYNIYKGFSKNSEQETRPSRFH